MSDRTRWLLWMERLKINWRSSLFQNFGSFPQTTILAEWLVGLRSVRYEKYCDFRFWFLNCRWSWRKILKISIFLIGEKIMYWIFWSKNVWRANKDNFTQKYRINSFWGLCTCTFLPPSKRASLMSSTLLDEICFNCVSARQKFNYKRKFSPYDSKVTKDYSRERPLMTSNIRVGTPR